MWPFSTKPKLQYKAGTIFKRNGSYYRQNSDGTQMKVQQRSDGYLYWKQPDGKVVRTVNKYKMLDGKNGNYTYKNGAVQDVDKNGKPIKSVYIGGKKQEARDKFWKQAPIMQHAVDSIAQAYKINPAILRKRLDIEGFTDAAIRYHNSALPSREYSNYENLNGNYMGPNIGFEAFGLDDFQDYMNDGKIKLIRESWYPTENQNEQKRWVNSASGITIADNIGMTAATLKYFRDLAKRDFPNASEAFLDFAAGAYYNRGAAGGKKYMLTYKQGGTLIPKKYLV